MKRIYLALARLLLLLLLLQFYFAGLAVFGAASFSAHARLGQALVLLGLGLFAAAWPARPESRPWQAGLLALLLVAQPVLAFAPRANAPSLAAAHALAGALALLLAAKLRRNVA